MDLLSDPLIYFAYGSNMHPLRLQQRVPSSKALTVAILNNYLLRFHKRGRDGSGKCNVYYTGRNDDRVIGVLYTMSRSEKYLLDHAEGLGIGYDEQTVTIRDAAGQTINAFCYVATEKHIDDSLQPFSWYKALVAHGARIHGFPDDYQQQIAAIEAMTDPDLSRNDLHLDILHRYETSL